MEHNVRIVKSHIKIT